jgi:hypothetical protein
LKPTLTHKQLLKRLKGADLTNLSEADRAILEDALKKDTIPKGHYRVKRLSAWISRKGFDYVVSQKFRILEGEFAGRELVVLQELDDSDQLELKEDAEV